METASKNKKDDSWKTNETAQLKKTLDCLLKDGMENGVEKDLVVGKPN